MDHYSGPIRAISQVQVFQFQSPEDNIDFSEDDVDKEKEEVIDLSAANSELTLQTELNFLKQTNYSKTPKMNKRFAS